MTSRSTVMLMAYGTPRGLDDVESYYTHIRHGRPPAPEQLEDLTERYRAIGGRSPLLEITRAQAKGLEDRLELPIVIGMKHAAPFIRDAVESLVRDGRNRAIGLALAPHYSAMSIGDYAKRVHTAADELGWDGTFTMVESWHLEPGYISLLADRVRETVAELASDPEEVSVVFTAHSLPASIVAKGDPYAQQLKETAAAVAAEAGVRNWHVGYQSAALGSSDWLGPDVLEILDEGASGPTKKFIVCPCGFVADHLEILYDIDIEAQSHAEKLGLELRRTLSPNDDPRFLDVLATIARRALAQE